jgi:hypothetical protein
MKKTLLSFGLALFLMSLLVQAKPKTTITYGKTLDGFFRAQVKNETNVALACYIALDGFKTKFQLPRKTTSRWVATNDKRFGVSDFSIWCDYLDIFPEYKQYRKG